MTIKNGENLSDDQKIALDWIRTIESEKSKIRERDIYPKLKAWVNHVAPKKIIEIGCGQGICSDRIELVDRTYTGIDHSQLLIERAKQIYSDEGRRFLLGNAYDIPISDCTFDAAFSISVWHLLNDLQKATEELSRILNSQGHFLIISANPSAYSLWTDLYEERKVDGKRFEGKVQLEDKSFIHEVLYLHTLEEITTALEAVNLRVQNIETFRTSASSRGQAQFVLIAGKKSL